MTPKSSEEMPAGKKSAKPRTLRKPRERNTTTKTTTTKRSKKKTTTSHSVNLSSALDIAAAHWGLPFEDVSKVRSTAKTMTTLLTDSVSRQHQATKLRDLVIDLGMPETLAHSLPLDTFLCLRSHRIRYNTPAHTEEALQRHPDKCLLWKGMRFPNGTFRQMSIYIKGKVRHSPSGSKHDAILEISHFPYVNAPHLFEVNLHVGNSSSTFRYSNLGKNSYYKLLSMKPSSPRVAPFLSTLCNILTEACKPLKKRKAVPIEITERTSRNGYGPILVERPSTFHFTPHEDAEW